MSRFLRPSEPEAPRRVGRSVYDERFPELRADLESGARWALIGQEDPFTGGIEFERDWPRLVTGWTPLDEFMRRRTGGV